MSEKTHSTNVLNKLVICDHNRGKIKYVGPIYGVNNDSGKPKINIFILFIKI